MRRPPPPPPPPPFLLFASPASDLPPAPKLLPPAADYKSDVFYGGKYEDKKPDLSGLGLDGFSALQKKDKNPYGQVGMGGGAGAYDEKKERKDGASALVGAFGQKAVGGAAGDKYSLGNVVGSKWDMPPNPKDAQAAGGNFPSLGGGRSSFIRNARYAPGVNPSSVMPSSSYFRITDLRLTPPVAGVAHIRNQRWGLWC